MNTQISIEQLAEKLGGNLWSKGDIKRIYLDRGYNTKKMSTKTYVYQREDGSFGVSCYIECPSQNFAWIKSQQEEVIESVESKISRCIWEIENPEGDYDAHSEELEKKVQMTRAQKDFLKNIETKKESWRKDYENAVVSIKKYDDKFNIYNNASDEEKEKISQLEAELLSIIGTPNSKVRRSEIEAELALLPCKPSGPDYAYGENGWMRIAAAFKTLEEYIDFKVSETKKELNIND